MDPNLLLWIGQILLALAFLGVGYTHTLAIVLHARRSGEGRNIVVNAILGAIATLIAYGRFVVAPF